MANLIITIISIGLVAVAAAMAIFYGGAAFENSQTAAIFNAWTSQNSQILAAAQVFSLDHGGTDVVPMCGLYNGKYLSTWPNLINGAPSPYGFPPNQGAQMPYQGIEGGCWTSGANAEEMGRSTLGYHGAFVEFTQFVSTSTFGGYCQTPFSTGWDNAGVKNSLPVKLALLFNQSSFSNLPSGLTITASGLPASDASWATVTADSANNGCSGNPPQPNPTPVANSNLYVDSTGKILTGCFEYSSGTRYLFCQQMQ